jgi:hypothetical protein
MAAKIAAAWQHEWQYEWQHGNKNRSSAKAASLLCSLELHALALLASSLELLIVLSPAWPV